MDDSVSSSEARDKAETKEYVSVLDEMEEKVSGSAETKGKLETKEKEKVSIAVAKEKVSHAAAKGGKAFMNLVHMAIPQSPKESKANGSPKLVEGEFDKATTDSPKSSIERKVKLVSDESPSSSPDSSLERNAKQVFDESTPISPKSNADKKKNLVSKIKKGLKVGKKSSDAENRSQLLDEKPVDPSPRVRSTDSIKIAYGHKPSTDPTSIAAQNREKLIERQEKLQAMNNQSEEMMNEAGNFASMAEQLAKQIENKKWYQL